MENVETNMGNSELLYEVIDTLSDEEFQELLDNLDISENAEDVIAQQSEEGEEETSESMSQDKKTAERKRLVAEKLEELAKNQKSSQRQQLIKERLANARKKQQIQEKLQSYRRRKAVQEKLEAVRKNSNNSRNSANKQVSEYFGKSKSANVNAKAQKIQEKIELAKKKKAVMERIQSAKAAAKKN